MSLEVSSKIPIDPAAGPIHHQGMFICFIDEAGTPEPKPSQLDDVFVLSGVVIPAMNWGDFDSKTEVLKRKYGLMHKDELHSTWLARPFSGPRCH